MGAKTYVQITDPELLEKADDARSMRRSGMVELKWTGGSLWNNGEGWYAATNSFEVTLVPDPLLDNRFGVLGIKTEIDRFDTPVDANSAWQGMYIGTGDYQGCTAKVTNRVFVDKRVTLQKVEVAGPYRTAHAFFLGISQRRISPDIWLQPKPRFFRLRVFLGLL